MNTNSKFWRFLLIYVQINILKADIQSNLINSHLQPQLHNRISFHIDNLLSGHLNHCYIVHYRNLEDGDGPFTSDQKNVHPTIEINSRLEEPTSLFNEFDKIHISRHSQQCKIYLIHPDNQDITKIFTNPALQVQAQQSYVILLEQSKTMAEKFLFSTNLNSFKHRIWLQIPSVKSEQNSEFPVEYHRYCYTCSKGAKPALVLVPFNAKFPNSEELFSDVTRNLNGQTLKCTAPWAPPLVAIVNSKTNGNEKVIVGMQAIILKDTAAKMNFTFTLKQATGGATGIPLSNGTWTGIMGEVLSNEADIGLSVSTTYERSKVLEFTTPVFHAFLVLVATKPLPHFDWEAIFYPFGRVAWTAILSSTIITVICYQFLHNKSKVTKLKKSRQMSAFKSAYLAVGALLEQGVPIKVTSTPSRVYAGFWFLLAIVLTCAYRSKLFLFLTFPTIEKPPSTLQELSVSDYTWGMKSLGGVGLELITKSPLAYSRYIGEHMELSFDKHSCLDKTFTHRFVCIIYRAYIDLMAVVRYWKVSHKLQISDYVTSSVGASWVVPKYSPLLPILNKYQISQFEMGLANKYVENYQQEVAMEARAHAQVSNSSEDVFRINVNYVREVDGPKPLKLGNLGGAFFILLFGMTFGFGLFLVEILKNYKWKTKHVNQLKVLGRIARYYYRRVKQRQNNSC